MKCKNCGYKVGKNYVCPRCGLSYPKYTAPIWLKIVLVVSGLAVVAVIGVFIALKIYDSSHQSNALLPGIYAGMTKKDFNVTLKNQYPSLAGGKYMENPKVREGADTISYVAYATYCNALSINGAAELEVTFVSSGGTEFVDSYKLSVPFIADANTPKLDSVVEENLNKKIIPMLEGKYGVSDETDVEYEKHFGLKESVRLTISRADQLLGFKDAALTSFAGYNEDSFCARISYQGSSSQTLFNVLEYVK